MANVAGRFDAPTSAGALEIVPPHLSCAPWMRQGLFAAWMPALAKGKDLTGRRLDLSPLGTVSYDGRGLVIGATGGGLQVGHGKTYTNLPPQALAPTFPILLVWVGELTATPGAGMYSPDLLNWFVDNTDNPAVAALQINGTNIVPIWTSGGNTSFPDLAYGTWPLNQTLVIVGRFERTGVSVFVDGKQIGATQTTGQPYTATAPSASLSPLSIGAYDGFTPNQSTRTRYAAIYMGRSFSDEAVRRLSKDPMAGFRPRD